MFSMKKIKYAFCDPDFVKEARVEWRHFVCSESGDAEQRVCYACDICGDSKIIIKSRGGWIHSLEAARRQYEVLMALLAFLACDT
jgi:hypothetical protein